LFFENNPCFGKKKHLAFRQSDWYGDHAIVLRSTPMAMSYGAIFPQNKQMLCRYFTIVEHLRVISIETLQIGELMLVNKEKLLYSCKKT
jgi:hypothetical protein